MLREIFALLLGVAFLTNVAAQGYAAGTTAVERAQLPTYCYPQYVDSKLAQQPGYSIPRSCGVAMNHFCPGLIYLIRARKASDPPNIRRDNANRAITDINYTLRGMPKECPLRADAEAALARAKSIANTAR